MHDFWAANDLQLSPLCPLEIVDDVPAVVIVDNDDFKMDTVTGNAACAHRTNVMYVQPITIEKKIERTDERIKDASVLSKTLKTISTGLEKVPPYKTVNNSEPPVRIPPATTCNHLPKITTCNQ